MFSDSASDFVRWKKIFKVKVKVGPRNGPPKFWALLAEIVHKDGGIRRSSQSLSSLEFPSKVFYLNKVSIKPKEHAPFFIHQTTKKSNLGQIL